MIAGVYEAEMRGKKGDLERRGSAKSNQSTQSHTVATRSIHSKKKEEGD